MESVEVNPIWYVDMIICHRIFGRQRADWLRIPSHADCRGVSAVRRGNHAESTLVGLESETPCLTDVNGKNIVFDMASHPPDHEQTRHRKRHDSCLSSPSVEELSHHLSLTH